MREIPEMRCGEIRSDKMWSGDAFWPRPCLTLGVGHKNVHQARLGVMATRNQDYNIYIYCYCSCCYCCYTITTNTTTHADISHNTIAALLLGYYTVMGSLLCGMGCRWDWRLRLCGPCERLKVHLLSCTHRASHNPISCHPRNHISCCKSYPHMKCELPR